MRLPLLIPVALSAVMLAACGGKAEEAPPANPPAAAPAASTGAVVDINMTGDGTTTAKYDPDHVTIAAGTTLRFHNVSGSPHNISFWPDSIPAGAAAVLGGAMHDAVGELQGALLVQPDQTYEISFAGAPGGEYQGYCLPHLALGMRIWVTVTP